nr:LysR substrate-binding domain-containing protein [Tianweitania sediminis]
MERAVEDVRRADSHLEGTIVIGLPVSNAALLSLPIVKETRARQTGIRLQINATPSQLVVDMIRQGRIDLGIIFDDVLGPELSTEPLIDEELVYFTAGDQPDGDLPEITLRAIARQPLMIPGPPNSISKRLSVSFEAIGEVPNIIAEIDALSSIIGGVAEGLAGAVLPWAAVKHSPGARVSAYRIAEPKVVRRMYLCHSATTPLTRAGAVVHDIILSETRQLIMSGSWKAATLTV